MNIQVFGKKPSGERLQRILRSPHYRKGAFRNIEYTTVMRPDASYLSLAKRFLTQPDDVRPKHPLESVRTNLLSLPDGELQIVWFGHSSYLLHFMGKNILVDPVFSGHASPFRFFGKAFPGTNMYKAADIPPIDLLVITHDHYDHLDYKTIVELQPKVKQVCTALGVGAHLEYWGYPPGMLTELDWGESYDFGGEISMTATTSRHFSGRMLKRGQTLWSSFVLDFFGRRIFIGGDSGYGKHFGEIGNAFGPFDVAMLECGQYGDEWPLIHMTPEQTVQAAVDLRTEKFIPVHWGKFALSIHAWDDPVKRGVKEATRRDVPVIIPTNGLPISIIG